MTKRILQALFTTVFTIFLASCGTPNGSAVTELKEQEFRAVGTSSNELPETTSGELPDGYKLGRAIRVQDVSVGVLCSEDTVGTSTVMVLVATENHHIAQTVNCSDIIEGEKADF